MKIFVSFFLVLSILLCGIPVSATATDATESLPPADDSGVEISSIHGIDANHALLGTEQLIKNARSIVVFEANSETLMYAWNPDAQMYPASLVKIMTVLIAIEETELTDIVTVSQEAVSSVPSDAVSAKLLPGEKLSVQDLLYCILLSSASDACVAIAEHVGGSVNGFVDMMNQRANEMGCLGTYFTNPHGLHDDNQHTTARDSARILSVAMKSEAFRKIFAADDYMVEKTNLSENRRITTGNYMKDTNSKLYYDSRVIGGRTGVTQDGRRCLATAAERNGMQLITVIMGSESVYQEDGYSAISIGGYRETTKLLDICLDGYKTVQLLFENQALRQAYLPNGDCDLVMGPQISVSTVIPFSISADNLEYRYTDKSFTLPIEKGQHVSDLQIWHSNMCVAQAELYALNRVDEKITLTPDEDHVDSDNSVWVIWLILVILLLGFGYVLIRYPKKIRRIFMRRKNRRHSRDRRRNR